MLTHAMLPIQSVVTQDSLLIMCVIVFQDGKTKTVLKTLMIVLMLPARTMPFAMILSMATIAHVMKTTLENFVTLHTSVLASPVQMGVHAEVFQTTVILNVIVLYHLLAKSVKYLIHATVIAVRTMPLVRLMELPTFVNAH